MPDGRWVAEFYEGPNGETPVETWVNNLSGVQFAALDAAIKYVLEPQGLGLASGKWLTALGGGVYEFRIRHSVSKIERMYAATTAVQPPAKREPVLLRLFVHFYGQRIILLLHGYDKGADDSPRRQQKQIKEAARRLGEWKRRGGKT